ncbi:hypothetical protein HPB51_022393 [Rhipicephalus microplus]|uniref:Atos-like conserved domain-containing protein n=1 Tax=Rhipicephalus microplus TaxID=6941 RepID=A0A9J6DQZ0_RHIMP|nr:hypothetical protein HPB51_022393 [Rhipicephalus microplus]
MRSYLSFSQIASWYNLSHGRSPRGIYYRISVPGEAFSSKFRCSPEVQNFPMAGLGRNTCLKVSVKFAPRCPDGIPAIACAKHSSVPLTPAAPNEPLGPTITATLQGQSNRNANDDGFIRNEESVAKRKPKKHSKGDFPSRCGSPSVEVPEHLLFGSQAQSPLELSGEAQTEHKRGRAPRRPVIERFLKKSGESLPGDVFALDAPTASSNQVQPRKEEIAPTPFWPNQQYIRARSLAMPLQAPEPQASFVPVTPQSPLLLGNEQVITSVKELGENKQTDKFARAVSPDQCGLKNSFEDMSLCHINKPSAKHKLISSSSCSVLQEQPLAAKPHFERTSKPNVKDQCVASVVTDDKVELRTFVKEQKASGSKCDGGVAAHKEEANHNKRGLGHSKTWSEGLCDLKLKDGVVGKGSHIFNNLIHKHKVRQAPLRKSGASFDFDSSLTSVSAIKRALFEKEPEEEEALAGEIISSSAPASTTTSSLIVNFEESVLNGRLEPVSTVQGFVAEIGASGSFCPRHITLPVTVFFYSLHDIDKVVSPYLGHINLGMKGYHVPKTGTIQVTLFNPHKTVVKMFVVRYDLSDMPPNCQTFIRQRTLFMPTDASEKDPEASRWLRYLIHLRFASSKSGRIYLHTDVRVIVFRKSDLDAATIHGDRPYELRSFTQCPVNPKFSPCE